MHSAVAIVTGDKVHRPLLSEFLSTDDLKVSREELFETPETRETALRVFRKMLLDQNEFTPRTDEVFLLRFLRVRKFNVEKAFKMLKDHYKFRSLNPEVYLSPSGVEKALRAGIFNYLPNRDHMGRAVFVVKYGRWNPDKIPYTDLIAAGNLAGELVVDNPVTQINGYVGIWDYKGFSWKHAMPFCSPKNLMLVVNLMQDRFPGRFKVAYCVNCVSYANYAWNVIKQVLKEKFKNRIRILIDIKDLHQYVDPSILPAEFGGTFPPIDHREVTDLLLYKEQYFNYNRKFGY